MIIQGAKYPSDFEAKKAIIEIGRRMYNKGFVAANDGNISCKVGPNTIWTTPTGVSKGFMTLDMLVKMDTSGKVLAGNRKPSSEVKMHLRVYQENPDIMAVTHAHPPVATSFAIAGISLETPVLPEAVVQLGSVPVAHYATPGTQEVPDSIAPYCRTHNGVLLANHGALSWGKDIFEAYFRLESMEYYATILMYTGKIIQKQNELSCEQVDELLTVRKNLGIHSGGIPPCNVKTGSPREAAAPVQAQRQQEAMAPVQAQSWQEVAAPVQAQSQQERAASMPAQSLQEMAASVSIQSPQQLSGVTPIVRPAATQQNIGCGCTGKVIKQSGANESEEKNKEEIIAEIVRLVTEKMMNNNQ